MKKLEFLTRNCKTWTLIEPWMFSKFHRKTLQQFGYWFSGMYLGTCAGSSWISGRFNDQKEIAEQMKKRKEYFFLTGFEHVSLGDTKFSLWLEKWYFDVRTITWIESERQVNQRRESILGKREIWIKSFYEQIWFQTGALNSSIACLNSI